MPRLLLLLLPFLWPLPAPKTLPPLQAVLHLQPPLLLVQALASLALLLLRLLLLQTGRRRARARRAPLRRS